MNHDELVERAAKWLRNTARCSVVITEMVQPETADAIGFGSRGSILIECKSSRSDFMADAKKFFRQHPDYGMGDKRYYMTPSGLISPDELPDGWGLLEPRGAKTFRTVKSGRHEKRWEREQDLLISALRRVGQVCPRGISVKAYTYETKCTATLGVAIDEAGQKKDPG